MARFDRYFLSQLMLPFGVISLVLVLVYWLNRAVILFDQLIANGHSALVFLEFTVLTVPNVVRLVLPVASFAAVVYCTNRLSAESELVVVQSTGSSPWQLARPVLWFGLIVAAALSILNHYLVPLSKEMLATRQAEIDANTTAQLLREGEFIHPAGGLTFFVTDVAPTGEMRDLFLTDRRGKEGDTNYAARRALLLREGDSTKLLMFDGMVQSLDAATKSLATTTFDTFVLDITELLARKPNEKADREAMPTTRLIWPDEATVAAVRGSRAVLLETGHRRFSGALFAISAALVGFGAMVVGGFSRFGLMRQIFLAVGLLTVLALADNFLGSLAQRDEHRWALVYLTPALGLVMAAGLLWLAGRPALVSRRRRVAA